MEMNRITHNFNYKCNYQYFNPDIRLKPSPFLSSRRRNLHPIPNVSNPRDINPPHLNIPSFLLSPRSLSESLDAPRQYAQLWYAKFQWFDVGDEMKR